MAKRFYDNKKYKDPWFRTLSPDLKCVYDYCLCECDHAGVLELDPEDMNFRIRPARPITLEMIEQTFKNKFVYLDEKIVFIPKFLYWQYKNELTPANSVHRSVYGILKHRGINTAQFLAPGVMNSDFERWPELLKEIKEDGTTYKEVLKSRTGRE